MIAIGIVLLILFIHWVADFVCQTRWMSQNKSKNIKALLLHTTIYTVVNTSGWWVTGIATGNVVDLSIIAGVSFIVHTATDYITSRINLKLWASGKIQGFFTAIGFDQLLHYLQLFGTWYYLYALL